jgi:hypothetical protein
MGRVWVHAALAVVSRFVIDLRVGPRTLELAADLVASVAMACVGQVAPLFLIDNHLPYPAGILQVWGDILHGRRRNGRGRRKHPRLKPQPGLLAAVVEKIRDASGRVLRVRARRLFGRLRDVRRRLRKLKIGQEVNTAHVERLNGTIRCQQGRLARRTRKGSRLEEALQWSLWLWRDLYNWTRAHASLLGSTPAMVLRLASAVWSVRQYVLHPVHVSDLQQAIWAEQRQEWLTSALARLKPKETVPTS